MKGSEANPLARFLRAKKFAELIKYRNPFEKKSRFPINIGKLYRTNSIAFAESAENFPIHVHSSENTGECSRMVRAHVTGNEPARRTG